MKSVIKLGSLAATAVVGALAYKFVSLSKEKSDLPDGFTVTAHSGSENTADNSMEFIEKCIQLGVDVLEVDVTFREDGTPVMLHKGLAKNDEGVLLDEALKYISENSDTVLMNLDLKAFDHIPEVASLVEKYKLVGRCFFTGVRSQNVEAVRCGAPEIPYYLNMSFSKAQQLNRKRLKSAVDQVKEKGAVGINCNFAFASVNMVKLFHDNELKVSYWTADLLPTMKFLLSIGPDNITTHKPITLRELASK